MPGRSRSLSVARSGIFGTTNRPGDWPNSTARPGLAIDSRRSCLHLYSSFISCFSRTLASTWFLYEAALRRFTFGAIPTFPYRTGPGPTPGPDRQGTNHAPVRDRSWSVSTRWERRPVSCHHGSRGLASGHDGAHQGAHASHFPRLPSASMAPPAKPLAACIRAARARRPERSFISNVTGCWGDPASDGRD